MTKRTYVLVLLAGSVLAGCDMAPRYVQPQLPVPPASPAGPAYAADPAGETALPADTAWADFFRDARLQQVIGTALANNRDLRVALARVEQARAQYRVQRADIFPTLGADGSATYQKSPLATGGTAGAGAGRSDIYSASVGVSAWEIDLFGRVRNLSKAGQEQFFAARANRDAAQTALVAEVATAWLTMAADQDRLRIARETAAAYEQTVGLTEARFAAGIASELDVRQARTSRDQARSDIAAGTTLVAQDRNALNLLAGTTLDAAVLPETLGEQGVTLDNLPADLPSDVLLRRPDVIAAEHQLKAANANIGAARAAFFPKISLTAAFGTLSSGLSGLFGAGSDFWSVAPSASLPIFDFGRNAGNLGYAKATRDAMVAQYERAVQSAFREVADGLARRGTIEEQIAAQTSLRDNARVAYSLSEARFKAGVDPFLTTLDSQRSFYAAQQSLLAVRLVREANAVELYRALGGGLK
ncbi:MAG: efflux transporter outer membrane subunit [Sphingomonadales bacterium]|nr:efflux transporter outer membrane subunit [Sphingomonadales bacterium]MBU3991650.1 efflux transporter outer membrane subunit [Alphaproteobacteria bacterium]